MRFASECVFIVPSMLMGSWSGQRTMGSRSYGPRAAKLPAPSAVTLGEPTCSSL